MRNEKFQGYSLYRNSRYYLDPARENGEVKVVKPADPEKLQKVREAKARRTRNDFVFPFNGHLSKAQIKRIREVI